MTSILNSLSKKPKGGIPVGFLDGPSTFVLVGDIEASAQQRLSLAEKSHLPLFRPERFSSANEAPHQVGGITTVGSALMVDALVF